jgi:arsenate reductase (thioredoxin)
MTAVRPTILFVCVHNAGRSQMAAAFAEELGGDRVDVRSAGTEPAEHVNPGVVAAMREVGIDLTSRQPHLLQEESARTADVVVTMGCGDACPVFPGTRYEDWELEDPAGRPLQDIRRIRDDIRERVRDLVSSLDPAPNPGIETTPR